MIRSVEVGNFLSHAETKLDFDNGVTVFVGHNGAGKSSIIDAITFALFGQHTRKSNKGLIKHGTNQAFAKVHFTVNGKQYLAERKIDSKGTLSAKFSEIINDESLIIASGERKQFGESMSKEIEKKIGLEFEKLKIASIVQQGELNSIIKAQPKEFKEMLNAIIGIDKLDIASESMKIVQREFREKLRKQIGYDYTDIDLLKEDLETNQKDLQKSIPEKTELIKKRKAYNNELLEMRTKLEKESTKIDKLNQLETRKKELITYAKDAIHEIRHEIAEKQRKIMECESCFEYLQSDQGLESECEKIKLTVEQTQKKLRILYNQKISLEEKQSLAAKLCLKDNKCPVCDSKVDKLNPLFQKEYLKQELLNVTKEIIQHEKEVEYYNKKIEQFSDKIKKATHAKAILNAYSIRDRNDLRRIQQEINLQKNNVEKIPLNITTKSLIEISSLDSHTKRLFEDISKLEKETKEFHSEDYINLRTAVDVMQNELSQIDQKIGAIGEKISKAQEEIKLIEAAISELKIVKKFVEKLESIQNNVFNRDGPVASSLRSWALNAISAKASEYLSLLNTKIQRIFLREKIRDISISCYSKNKVLDLESLSGGEQVSVALALRLGMANLLGSSNLNLMILDEPTMHLDTERRKALVGVLSQLSDMTTFNVPMQFIIITHDSEIFEDSTVEKIYKFESVEHGSKVIDI